MAVVWQGWLLRLHEIQRHILKHCGGEERVEESDVLWGICTGMFE